MLFIKSLLLGVGLSMDAVAVSMANGLKNPQMKEERKLSIAFSFGLYLFARFYPESISFRLDNRLGYLYLILLRHTCREKVRYGLCRKCGYPGRNCTLGCSCFIVKRRQEEWSFRGSS